MLTRNICFVTGIYKWFSIGKHAAINKIPVPFDEWIDDGINW